MPGGLMVLKASSSRARARGSSMVFSGAKGASGAAILVAMLRQTRCATVLLLAFTASWRQRRLRRAQSSGSRGAHDGEAPPVDDVRGIAAANHRGREVHRFAAHAQRRERRD